MNGSIPEDPGPLAFSVPELVRVQIMEEGEIATRRDPAYRLPRQAEHFTRLIDQILNVKDNSQLRRSPVAHFSRLSNYYESFLR